jgi:hypothetical protein
MLIGNYSVYNKNPGRWLAGGSTTGNATVERCSFNQPGSSRNIYYADRSNFNTGSSNTQTHPLFVYGNPMGCVPPYSWMIPQIAGGMAMRLIGGDSLVATLIPQQPTSINLIGSGDITTNNLTAFGNIICALTGSTSFSATIQGNGNITISFTGSCSFTLNITGEGVVTISLTGTGDMPTPTASLIMGMVCALSGSGNLTSTMLATVLMVASLTGDCTVSASITGQKSPTCSMTGSGNLSGNLTGFAEMITNLLGSSSLSALPKGLANASIDIVVTGTGLNTANVAQAVWNAVATEFDNAGTLGGLLNNVGAGANPWDALIEGSVTAEEALKTILSVLAGKTIIVPGASNSATVKFRDVNDTRDSVTATMNGSQRTNVILNNN